MNKGMCVFVIIMVIVIFITAAFSLYSITSLPEIVPSTAPMSDFSAERAKEHVLMIANYAHPTGSQEIKKVKQYILNQFKTMGISVKTESVGYGNILAKLPGTEGKNAVMLAAHYDSTNAGPGATDDTIGVASLLETARALKKGNRLKNDILLLFTDPEETGMQGADEFMRIYPWKGYIQLALNLDAGCLQGPAYIEETSPNNYWLIREYSKITPYPLGCGAKQAFGGGMSDFNAFNGNGLYSIYLGLTGDKRIHTPQDSIENFSFRTLQQMGTTTLSFAHHFGEIELKPVKSEDAVYFNLPLAGMIVYPTSWTVPNILILSFIFIGVVFIGFRKRILTLSGIAFGFLSAVLSLGVSVGIVAGLGNLFHGLSVKNRLIHSGYANTDKFFWIAFICITVALTLACYSFFGGFVRKNNISEISLGTVTFMFFSMIGLTFAIPMASYFMQVPMFLYLTSFGFRFCFYHSCDKGINVGEALLFPLNAILAVMIFVPQIFLGYVNSDNIKDSFLVSIYIVYLLGFLVIPLSIITQKIKWWTTAVLIISSFGFMAANYF